jgi:hypothetical protein
MKHFKYSILTILALAVTIGVVFAQPVPIGMDRQPNPFESNPDTQSATNMGAPTAPAAMWDGDLASYNEFSLGAGFGTSGNLVVDGFDVPANPFSIGWVDLKVRYQVELALTDDTYRLEYTTDGVNWNILVPDTSDAFTVGTNPPPTVPFAQIMPTDGSGVWTWAKLGSLRVRVYATRGGFGWDLKKMRINEVFATVYPFPLPKTSSPTISIQPKDITSGPCGMYTPNFVFVDVYVMDMNLMLGYEIVVGFDPGVLKAIQALTYYPFKSEVFTPVLDNMAGYVSMAYYTFGGDSVGFSGNGPVARIYFQVAEPGVPPTSDQSLIEFNVVKISDTLGGRIEPAIYSGTFWVAKYLSATDASLVPLQIDLANPVGTHWHEIYPTYSQEFDIVGWDDNGDGILSACDTIDLGTGIDYHVDQVTTTIWFTIKAGDPYGWDGMEMAVEPEEPASELPGSPIGTMWHQIFPPDLYSLTFEITSWDDDGSGVFDPSDQFDFEYPYFDPGMPHWAHLDAVSTDIIVSPPPQVPEFPLGLGMIMLLAPVIPLAYLWRLRKKRW